MSARESETLTADLLCRQVAGGCTECGMCGRDCRYLQQFGLPGVQARTVLENMFDSGQPFLCSLCGLCNEVCPQEIEPAAMFMALRNEAVAGGEGEFSGHTVLKNYERRGTSPLFSWYGLPQGCTTIFFPGCALAGTRSERIVDLYHELSRGIPRLGMVLDCCTKPSHDLGQRSFFNRQFTALQRKLRQHGIKEVLVACPSCFRIFEQYGEGIRVRTVYEQLADSFSWPRQLTGTVTVHDPCSARTLERVHAAVRSLITASGLTIEEMKHHGRRTLCCGEGGAVGYLNRELSANWGKLRQKEVEGRRVMTYCAGCTDYLGRVARAGHVLDLLFEPEKTLQGREKVSSSPFTYLNRLWLKRRLKKIISSL